METKEVFFIILMNISHFQAIIRYTKKQQKKQQPIVKQPTAGSTWAYNLTNQLANTTLAAR